MIITPRPNHGLDEVIGKSTGERSPGLHMSQIYGDIFSDLEPKRFVRGSIPNPLHLELGLAFEEMLEVRLLERWGPHLGERPPEQMTVEGIAYSPDLLIFDDAKGLILGEIKLSRLSSRDVPREVSNNFPPKFDRYFMQMKAYAYHLGTRHARLFVFFVNGSYAPPMPEFLVWDLTFSEIELRENWQMMLNHARAKGMIK